MDQVNKTGRWTEQQARAISEDRCNLLVAAAAGAGKTAVLVERIIRKISDPDAPVDIDRLLVVTFTSAAAAEMRERIGAALSKVLEAAQRDDEKYVKNLQRQLALLGKASITTIHSFCLEVVRNNFHTIDLDPGFRIADDTEALLLQLEALEELIESKYEPENCTEEFLSLVECYGGSKDDRKLLDLVLTVYDFIQSHPWPEVWLRDAVEAFNAEEGIDFGTTKWARVLMKSISMELSGLRSALEAAVEAAEKSEGLYPYVAVLEEDGRKVKAMLEACNEKDSWDELYEEFGKLEFTRLPRCGKEVDVKAQEEVKGIRDEVKGRLNKLRKELISSNSGELAEDLRQLYPVMDSLGKLVLEFSEKYQEKKKQKGIIDFNDLEHYCLKVLTSREEGGETLPTQAALALRERFEEIYIDEYQDSNLTQEVILSMVSREDMGEPNIFMVGDVKQSIYRFRQAKPELFIRKLRTYSAGSETKYRKILLNKNFRSREDIINGVNYIFGQIMSENLGEIDYTEDEALYAGAVFDTSGIPSGSFGGAIELHMIDSREVSAEEAEDIAESTDEQAEAGGLEPDTEDRPDSVQCEARIVAKRIKELTAEGSGFMVADKDTGKYRPVRCSDIVVLMRTTRNWADVFAEELSLQGLPVYTDTGSGYFRTIEISTIISLLQIIDNPLQDIPLLAVLRSPIGDFDTEELIDIRLYDREAAFFEAMVKASDEDGKLGARVSRFMKRLDRWREKALYLSTDELIWYLYNDTGYYSFVGAMPGGVRRQANLRMLFDKARQYEESSFKGLFNFINFINKLKGSQGDMGSAKTLGEKDDVVRIMSIHKSKGLEFPVVFLCGTGKGFNLTDTTKGILLHHDLGIGPDFIDHRRRIWYPTIFKQALKYKIRLESLSEEMRILYVAFTRAKEKLIITGTVNDPVKSAVRWRGSSAASRKVPEFDILKGKSFMDWICAALMRHPSKQLAEVLGAEQDSLQGGDEASRWDIRLWDREEVLRDSGCEEKDSNELMGEVALTSAEAASDRHKEIIERLEWKYPYSVYEKLPVKVTVTELKRHFDVELSEEYNLQKVQTIKKRPRFLEESTEMTAAEKGSLMHFVLQHLDFKGDISEAGIRKQLEAMVAAELLTEVQAQKADIRRIIGLLRSALGRRMLDAGRLFREVPFTMEVKCSEVFGSTGGIDDTGETIVLQGIIDCYFEEDGKLVLVDYKTDYIPGGELSQIKERYRTQIEYYARALMQITGKEIAGKYIYLFRNGEILEY